MSIGFNCSTNVSIYNSDNEIVCITDDITFNDEQIHDGVITLDTTETTQYVNESTNIITFNLTSSTLGTEFENHDFETDFGRKYLYSNDSDMATDENTKSNIVNPDDPSSSSNISATSMAESEMFTLHSDEFEYDIHPQIQFTTSHKECDNNYINSTHMKIKIYNIPYIRRNGILMQYFENTSLVQLPSVCLCPSQLYRSSCEGEFRLMFYTCPCNYMMQSPNHDEYSKRLTVLLATALLLLIITILGCGWFLCCHKHSNTPKDKLLNELEKELGKMRLLAEDKMNKNFDEPDYVKISTL